MTRWIWFMLFAACDSGSIGSSSQAIIDGRLASPTEVGATVALVGYDGYNFCTGTLVTPDVVVTAAHCLLTQGRYEKFGPPERPENVYVVAGATDALAASDYYGVSELTPHPAFPAAEYTGGDPLTNEMDIGVLVLSEPVRAIAPVPVLDPARLDRVLVPGTMLDTAGYGTTDPAGMRENSRLYLASMPYVRRSESELIAGERGGSDTCFGDSGGPLYADTPDGVRLLGVTSRGADPSSYMCGDGTIFTIAPAQLAWLEMTSGRMLTDGLGPDPDPVPDPVTPDAGPPGPEPDPDPIPTYDAGMPYVPPPVDDDPPVTPSGSSSGCSCDASASPLEWALSPLVLLFLLRSRSRSRIRKSSSRRR
jgi:hypothetical protein